jgi:CBS domain containing-hemolysin-like protein
MCDHAETGWWITFLFLSFLFSGIELAFIATGKSRYVSGNGNGNASSFMLDAVYSRFRRFQAALMTGRVILLVLVVYFTVLIVYRHSGGVLHNDFVKILTVVAAASLLLLLTNEYLPRILFGKNPGFWAKLFLFPAFLFYILLYPVAGLFVAFSGAILRLLGVNLSGEERDDVFYKVDFDSVTGKNTGDMSKEAEVDSEVKIFRNALDFSSKKVRDCMVPSADIVAVRLDTGIDKLKEFFIETGISRILVYKENLDNIVGYIHMWEIFNNPQDWTNNLVSVSFVPESMQANQLMSDLMQHRKSIAVVVDEFGSTSGIVTMEDLVEEIFGDIEDEYDVESKFVKQEGENEFVMSGRVEIDHLNEAYRLDIPESDEYSTVAGYLLHHMQRIPKTYETVIIGKYTFKILKVTVRKIEVVRLVTEGKTDGERLF